MSKEAMMESTNSTEDSRKLTLQSDLPDEVLRHVVLFLPPKDILSYLSVSTVFRGLSKGQRGKQLWQKLIERDGCTSLTNQTHSATALDHREDNNNNDDDDDDGSDQLLKEEFLLKSLVRDLTSMKWSPISSRHNMTPISAREGHVACIWSNPDGDVMDRRIVITGGFTDDNTVYFFHPVRTSRSTNQQYRFESSRIVPVHNTTFAYGASLTPLETKIIHDEDGNAYRVWKAVRFGGFRSGGYSGETNEVAVLTVKESLSPRDNVRTADWETIQVENSEGVSGRAYHSATLMSNRYLVVFGGMQSRASIQNVSILDTLKWKWIPALLTGDASEVPSARHGHSCILDEKRNRLLIFGGGSGSDLLRSGKDNSEVWELLLGNDYNNSNFEKSFPWKWNKIHETFKETEEGEEDEEGNNINSDMNDASEGAAAATTTERGNEIDITPLQALCLGRCHHGFKVAHDKAVFLFGSGRPSTNGILTYDLANDTFIRPGPQIRGIIPKPRFTGVAVYLEEGCILTHGGYCSQESECHDEFDMLDLAPERRRGSPQIRQLIDHDRQSQPEVTDEELLRGRRDPDVLFQTMIATLMETEEAHRQDVARQFLGQMHGHAMGGRGWLLMQMIANGAGIRFGDEGDDSDDQYMNDDDDDDDDYVDG